MSERKWTELEDLARQQDTERKRQRLDPEGCDCTDCIIGWSIPVTRATPDELESCIRTRIPANATGEAFYDLLERLERLDGPQR